MSNSDKHKNHPRNKPIKSDHISKDPFYSPANLAEVRGRANDVRKGKIKKHRLIKD
ncbi:hypothetical protein [Lentilactobacillus kisonensis]|uniref:Uncharacterized protein n=2 Tax=Lentilactobacillus kisonensis TaxID=481722 RepID=H1LHI6_9LACO|nr:hypothetical protein [Lentilactobacillus kisonensis]EHO50312.1 hypothetical protein HMPREF9104_02077 [Lentilactobacillus kisonensis F0435]KRL21248.1 hypothetical protein FC98_GL000838 [Lentilactobacillus kisonensis DSM 19906 = JCM 15041]